MGRNKEIGMKGERTTLTKANNASYSLRTTVPRGITSQLDLKEGDFLMWRLEPSKDGKGLAIRVEIGKKGET